MAKKLRNMKEPLKIAKIEKREDESPCFSFRYLGRDANYRFERFEKNPGEQRKVMYEFYQLTVRASSYTWREWFNMGKRGDGIETLEPKQLWHCKGTPEMMPQKYLSVRFGSQDAFRMIGYKQDAVFCVTGFDFDFSAYDHGS